MDRIRTLMSVRPIAAGTTQRVPRGAGAGAICRGDVVDVCFTGKRVDYMRRGVVRSVSLRGSVEVRYTESVREEVPDAR